MVNTGRGLHSKGLSVDGTRIRMNFPSEHCVIPRPCSSPREQGLPPCPGRLLHTRGKLRHIQVPEERKSLL